jgi:hypothetical protein
MRLLICVLFGLTVIACTPIQQQKTLVAGQLFCAKATIDGPLVVQVVDSLGAPLTVTDATAAAVQAVCASIHAIPVSPPANAVNAPIVAAPVLPNPSNKV